VKRRKRKSGRESALARGSTMSYRLDKRSVGTAPCGEMQFIAY
jgi:hypothetical protein